MKKALIISGLLRKVDKNIKYLNSLSKSFDVFICTSKEHEKYLVMFNDLKDYFLIEDDMNQKATQNFLLNLKEGSKLLQWHKLFIAKNMVIKYQELNGFKYDLIYKIRTDLLFKDNLNLDFDKHFHSQTTLFMNSDYYFGGCAEVMKKVCDFYIFSLTNYYDKNKIYQPLNFELFKNCDFDAAKFQWLKYPKKIVSNKVNFKDIIKILKNSNIFSSQSEIEPFVVFRDNHEKIVFPSEPAFLHYVLSLGLNVKKIQHNLINLDPDRKPLPEKTKFKKLIAKLKLEGFFVGLNRLFRPSLHN